MEEITQQSFRVLKHSINPCKYLAVGQGEVSLKFNLAVQIVAEKPQFSLHKLLKVNQKNNKARAEIQWSPNKSFTKRTEEFQLRNTSTVLSQVLCQGTWQVEI